MRKPVYFDAKEVISEANNWERETKAHHYVRAGEMVKPKTWRRSGLEKLVNEAIREFQQESGVRLPYNLEGSAPYVEYSRYWNHRNFQEVAIPVFRFYGWLKAASRFKLLIKFLQRNTSPNGMGSPCTVVDPFVVAKRHPSPGKLDCFLKSVRKRANQILKPYGLRVSWKSLAKVAEHGSTCRVGKAAIYAAGETVKEFCLKPFGELSGSPRKVLIKARGLKDLLLAPTEVARWAIDCVEGGEFNCFRDALNNNRLVRDNTDGVTLYLDPKTEKVIHGVKIVVGWSETYKYTQWLIIAGGRSFHCPCYNGWNERWAINEAFKSWGRQKELEKANEQLLAKLRPADRTILVYRKDSYAAGNCEAGTAVFAEENGFNGRVFVPAEWLLPHVGNPAVSRVLKRVASQL